MLLARCVDPSDWQEIWRKVILYVLIFKRCFIAQMFSALFASCVFFRLGFRLLCARLTVHSFAVNSGFGSLISKPLRQQQRIHWLCSVRYNFIHFFAFLYKIQHEKATFCVENVNYGGQFLELLFRILTLSYIFCWEYLWQRRQTEWIQIPARFVGWILSRFL